MKYLILGAGPAGLAFANKLKQSGVTDFLVLEKENTAGGLCRSVEVDGAPLDIGGGHFLDVRRPQITKFLFGFMPEEEWELYDRDSRIAVNGNMIGYPIEANIWQMGIEEQVEYLKSIATAGCNLGTEKPLGFVDWIYWKLGSKIAEDYMIPYNQKMFGDELDQLGTYWLEKLPDVSFEETLRSCLTKKAHGKLPGHAKFYYPKKYGYGELWIRMAGEIDGNIEYGRKVTGIDFSTRTVTDADDCRYRADRIVTTIPWAEFDEIAGMAEDLRKDIRKLKHTSIQTEYFSENLDTNAQWIYCPDLKLPYHRILLRTNFCYGSRGFWTETNGMRTGTGAADDRFSYRNKYAYPLNTKDKSEVMKKLLEWCQKQGVYGLGRWGEHQHYNSDVAVELAVKMAERLVLEE